MSTFLYREAMLSCSPVSMLYSPRKFTTLGLLEKPEENKKKCVEATATQSQKWSYKSNATKANT